MKRIRLLPLLLLFSLLILSCTRSSGGTSFTVSAQGGSYDAFQGATLEVPPNAVLEDVELTLRSLTKSELNDLAEGSFPVAAAFEALPDGQTFVQPVTVTLIGLTLEPGTIPLVRLIDPETGDRILVESNLEYDPGEGSLSFEVEHFTTYAVEAGEQVANTECQESPCRCGSITIQQSDASNTCSQDDCQILESEVSVQFNDCPGKPVETSYLKEVSPNCTPQMELKADRETIPPGGSTGLTAITSLSCVPVPDQNTDFFIEEGPGSLDPTNRITGQDGTAKTTYTAAEEEGAATVKVNATGSYYAYEVRANGESFNGPMLTYELTEEAEITIKELKGFFEASISGCNQFICLDDYEIKFDFNLVDFQDEDKWISTARVTQSGSLRSNLEYYEFDYINIPGTTEIDILGYFDQETGEYQMGVTDVVKGPLIEFLLINPENPDWLPFDQVAVGIFPSVTSEGIGELFTFNINDTPSTQEGTVYLTIMGTTPDHLGITGTYRLRIE